MRRGVVVLSTVVAAVAIIALVERLPRAPISNIAECGVVIGVLAVLAWATSGFLQNVLVVGISLLVGLTLVDGGLVIVEWLEPAAKPLPATADAGLSKARPIVGWGPVKPGQYHVVKTRYDGKIIFDAHYTIDDALNRKTVPSANTGSIAFFGDSFIFGEGLEDGETLPQDFAALNNGHIPVWNLAFSGWAPSHNLAALRARLYKPLLGSPRHFILFTTAFHVTRTACKLNWSDSPSPRYVLAGDELVNSGPCATSGKATLMRFGRRFALYERVERVFSGNTHRDVATFLKIVETFVATAKRDYNVPTTVLIKTDEGQYLKGTGYTEADVIDALRKAGVDVLVETFPPIADPSRYTITDDGHPSSLANRVLAQQVEDHLRAVDPAALGWQGAQAATEAQQP